MLILAKKWSTLIIIKSFIIVMSNNTLETMTKQQSRKKCKEKRGWFYGVNKEKPKKWLVIDTEDYLKLKKIRKENTQEKDSGIHLKRTDKT